MGSRAKNREAWTELAMRQAVLAGVPPVTAEQLAAAEGAAPAPKRSKYRNTSATVRNVRFESRLEADRFEELVLLRMAGEVAWFIRQAPFDVAPGVVYRADFVVVWNRAGSSREIVTVEDTKGFITPTARVKIAAVQEKYGFQIRLLRRADVARLTR